jgi:hypothetical protein
MGRKHASPSTPAVPHLPHYNWQLTMCLLELMPDVSDLQIHPKPPLAHAEPIPGPHPTLFANACDYSNTTSMQAYTHTTARSLWRSYIPPSNTRINSCLSFPKAKSPFDHRTLILCCQFPRTLTEIFRSLISIGLFTVSPVLAILISTNI